MFHSNSDEQLLPSLVAGYRVAKNFYPDTLSKLTKQKNNVEIKKSKLNNIKFKITSIK